jgi:hypothetical protein
MKLRADKMRGTLATAQFRILSSRLPYENGKFKYIKL